MPKTRRRWIILIVLIAGVLGGMLASESLISGNNWEDLRFPASEMRFSGVAPASDQDYLGGYVASFSSVSDNYVYVIVELPHSWIEGDNVSCHIHWVMPVSGTHIRAENVKWDLTYSWANINSVFPVFSSSTFTRDVQNVTADTHLYNAWVELDATGMKAGSIIIISVSRDVHVTGNSKIEAYLLEFDIHYRQDKLGSATIPP